MRESCGDAEFPVRFLLQAWINPISSTTAPEEAEKPERII
jgi:hypothetical protein